MCSFLFCVGIQFCVAEMFPCCGVGWSPLFLFGYLFCRLSVCLFVCVCVCVGVLVTPTARSGLCVLVCACVCVLVRVLTLCLCCVSVLWSYSSGAVFEVVVSTKETVTSLFAKLEAQVCWVLSECVPCECVEC